MGQFDLYPNITTLAALDEFILWQNSAAAVKNITFADLASEVLNEKTITGVWYEEVSATTGNVSAPAGGTLIADGFSSDGDALCSTITTTQTPDLEAPETAGGTPVTVSSFTVGTGAFVLSGTPSAYPVAVIFAYTTSLGDYDNTKNLAALVIDDGSGGGAIDYANPIAINTATALTIGRHHIISDLGSPADYVVTLPAVSGNADQQISWEIASDCTKIITVRTNEDAALTGTLAAGNNIATTAAGTVSTAGSSTTITGVGTSFTSYNVGDRIQPNAINDYRTITAIASDTSLTVDSATSFTSRTMKVWSYGVAGTGTAFTTELSVGDPIRVGVEYNEVVAINSNTSLIVEQIFRNSVSGATGYITTALIDGFIDQEQWANEAALLSTDATTWTKLSGKSIPMNFSARIEGNSEGLSSWATVLLNTEIEDFGGVFDLPNSKFVSRRCSTWTFGARASVTTDDPFPATMTRIIAAIWDATPTNVEISLADINGLSGAAGGRVTGTADLRPCTGTELILRTLLIASDASLYTQLGDGLSGSCGMWGTEKLKW